MQFRHADREHKIEIWIEDDGRTAWAFMRRLERPRDVLAAVWLYDRNVKTAGEPRRPEHRGRARDRYGPEFYETLGAKGGEKVKALIEQGRKAAEAATAGEAESSRPKPPQSSRKPAVDVSDEDFAPIASEGEVQIRVGGGPLLEATAKIFIRSKVHAYLEARKPTGWCVLVKRGSRSAKPLAMTTPPDGTADVEPLEYDAEY